MSYLIRRSDEEKCCARFLTRVSLATAGIHLLQQISEVTKQKKLTEMIRVSDSPPTDNDTQR